MSKGIEAELTTATGVQTKDGEERQEFLKRMMKAVNSLSDDQWGELSGEAQLWFNETVEAVKQKQPVPDFSVAEEDGSADSEQEQEPAEEDDVSGSDEDSENTVEGDVAAKKSEKTKKAEKKPKVEKKAKSVSKKSEGVVRVPRENGAENAVVKAVCSNPKLSAEEVGAQLTKAGIKFAPSTLRIQYSRTQRVLRALVTLGKIG